MLVWKPSLSYTLTTVIGSTLVGMFITGIFSLIFYFINLKLLQNAYFGIWAFISIFIWLLLICTPEDTEI